MRKGWIIFRIIGSLIMLALLIGGGFALFHMGWSQGYLMGAASAPAQAMPAPAYAYPYPPMHFGFMGFGMLIPLLIIGFIVMAGFRMIFMPFMWAGMGHHGRHHMMHCRGGDWESMPPHWKQWHEHHSQSPEEKEQPKAE